MASSESVVRMSWESPIREGISIACGIPSPVVSASRSSTLITPFKASSNPVIREDRFGDIGGPDLYAVSPGSNEISPAFSDGTEEGT